MGLHRCSCEDSSLVQAAECPGENLRPRPLAPSPSAEVLRPPTSFGPFAGGQGPALLDGCAKKFGIRTFWHNLALRLPVRAEVRTVCRGYPKHRFRCGLPSGPGGGPGGPGVRRSHTLGILLARLRRPVTGEIRRAARLSLGFCCLATGCTAWLSLIWTKVVKTMELPCQAERSP